MRLEGALACPWHLPVWLRVLGENLILVHAAEIVRAE